MLLRVTLLLPHHIVSTFRSAFARMASTSNTTVKKAGIIVIGDEILKGQTRDTNSHFFTKKLYEHGVKVPKISVIPDDIGIIAKEVRQFSDSFDFVLTCGGIGTTHDDKTFQGIAAAFDDTAVLNPELEAKIRFFFKIPDNDTDSPALKLAKVPSRAELVYGRHVRTGKSSLYPTVRMKNVLVFPGIPRLCERNFLELEPVIFVNDSAKFHTNQIYLDIDEVPIANEMTRISGKFEQNVVIGSYPKIGHSYYKTKLTVESTDNAAMGAASQELQSSFANHLVHYDLEPQLDCVQKFDKFRTTLANNNDCFLRKLDEAVVATREVLNEHPIESICLAFNGGKDCTAALHLLHVELCRKFGPSHDGVRALYVKSKSVFPEIHTFLLESCKRYNIDLLELPGPIKSALAELKACRPELNVIFMGSRVSDPNCHGPAYQAWTDADWPRFLRVTPLVHWTYKDIWTFIRGLCIPYCKLYDKGYTSLGCMNITGPNPALRYVDKLGLEVYKPAFMLQDESLERAGRAVDNNNKSNV